MEIIESVYREVYKLYRLVTLPILKEKLYILSKSILLESI